MYHAPFLTTIALSSTSPLVPKSTIISPLSCYFLVFSKGGQGEVDHVKIRHWHQMTSDVSASPLPFHQPYKLRRGGIAEIARHHHGENPSTSHHITTSYQNPLYRDLPGGKEPSNGGIEVAHSGSKVSSQHPTNTGRGEATQRWSFGRARRSVPPGAGMDMSGMILLPDPKRNSSNFTSSKKRRGDRTRAPGGRLGAGEDREGQASSGSLDGGKEPPIRGHGGLTTATFLKLVRTDFR